MPLEVHENISSHLDDKIVIRLARTCKDLEKKLSREVIRVRGNKLGFDKNGLEGFLKQISQLQSTTPWNAVDLDTILLSSLQLGSEGADRTTQQDVSEMLISASQALQSPEKRMTVEEWVRYRAEQGEEELRRRCERMVSTFEQEGVKALASVRGIQVAA